MAPEEALLLALGGLLLLVLALATRWRRQLTRARAEVARARGHQALPVARHLLQAAERAGQPLALVDPDTAEIQQASPALRSLLDQAGAPDLAALLAHPEALPAALANIAMGAGPITLATEGQGRIDLFAPESGTVAARVEPRSEPAEPAPAEALLEAALDALQSAVAVLDADGMVVAANGSWRQGFHGHLAGQGSHLVGQDHLSALEDLEAQEALSFPGLASAMRRVLEGEEAELVLERAFPGKGGKRWVEVRVTPYRHQEGTGLVVRYKDVTDRRAVERERRRASEQFEVAVGELARSVGSAADPEEVAERLVDAALRVSNAPVAAAVGPHGLMAIRGQDETQRERLREALHLRPSALVWVSASLPDAQTPLNLVLLPDGEPLTQGERNKIEILATQAALALQRAEVLHRVRSAYDRLDSSLMQKQVFLDVLSHDLKNPLAVVRGRLELMNLKHKGLSDDLSTIEKSLERAEKLIEKALFYSRLEDQEHIDRVDRDMVQLVWEVSDALQPLAEERGIALAVEGPDLLICPAHPMLARAVENLVSNAVKWSPEGSPVTVRLQGMPESARIEVIDHGPGIPEEERRKLFTRFQRVDHTGVKGTGLGLAIAKRIVEMHEGSIAFEETPGGGATFVLEVPRGQEVVLGHAADHVAPDLGELLG